MPDECSHVARARLASALTLDDASLITGMSSERYEYVEARPFEMTLGELRALCSEFNSDGKQLMLDWLNTFFGL